MAEPPHIQPTPLVALPAFGAQLFAKLEYVHPTRSAKYRALVPHLQDLAASGELDGVERVVIRSAGCAAITTAWACQRLGIKAEAVIPMTVDEGIAAMLNRLGATVHTLETEQANRFMASAGGDPSTHVVDQFHDPRLVDFYRPLAGEILEQLPDVAAIVVGIGTAATIMGVGGELRTRQSACRVVGVWPAEFDPDWRGTFTPHGISGLAPPVRATHLDPSLVDGIRRVSTAEALECADAVFRSAGLPVGPSSGATLAAALQMRAEGFHGPVACIFASTCDAQVPEPG